MKRWLFPACALATVAIAFSQAGKLVKYEVTGHVLRPEKLPADVKALKVPPGFRVEVFAKGVENARIMAVSDEGDVYVTRPEKGDCVLLQGGSFRTVATHPKLHGIAFHGKQVYFATVKDILMTERRPDGSLGPLTKVAGSLPDGGQHPNRTLAFGPDGLLYVSIGSSCNDCAETNPEHATVIRMKPDGSAREVFAKGLRNTIGFGWHPESKQMFGMDHGIDWLGDEEQKEELNLLERGGDYGWPFAFADGQVNRRIAAPPGVDPEQVARDSKKPVAYYTPHAAPMQMAFYTGSQFPAEYRGDAFVAMRGSWNRQSPSGYEVVRIRFRDGRPSGIEPFLTGFVTDQGGGRWGHRGRLVGLAIAKDGSLLVGDDTNGVIYRVTSEQRAAFRR